MKTNLIHLLITFFNIFFIFSLDIPDNGLQNPEGESTQSSITKEFDLTRTEIENSENNEETFWPYIFTSNIFGEGNYVFDTASFFSWKYNRENKEIGEYTFKTKKNENLKGKIQFDEENMNYIEINNADSLKKKYSNNFGVICIPKSIPERIKNSIITEDDEEEIKFSYLDLIKTELNEDEQYINYIQDTINTGKIIFGKKNEIFDVNVNDKEIKSCACISPPNTAVENEFLNFWNCKIDSFFIENIKFPASYSISLNGEIFAIFAIEEEYIIAPKVTGNEIINYYKKLINDNYGTSCELQDFTTNTKIMLCKSFNFAELPDFNIILDGEIYLIALSFDLFKEKNDTHLYFKILLNEANTREYWYLGDPIIKNYNLLFDYTKTGNETITIVQSDKYESMVIILFFLVSSVITLLFFVFLIVTRVKKINKENYIFQDEAKRKQSKKIKKIIKDQNDFEVPEENVPVQYINNNNAFSDENKKQNLIDIEEESNSGSIDSSIDTSKSLEKKEKNSSVKNTKLTRRNATEIEMSNLAGKFNLSDDDESDLNADDEGGIQAFNHTKLKKQ